MNKSISLLLTRPPEEHIVLAAVLAVSGSKFLELVANASKT